MTRSRTPIARRPNGPRSGILLPLAAILALGLATALLGGCAKPRAAAVPRADWKTGFTDDFEREQVVSEQTTEAASESDTWWLSSGARFVIGGGVAGTIQGESPKDYYRERYALRNPRDTDGGRYPQNLFRIVTRESWSGDVMHELAFRVTDYRLSDSPQRYAPNGVLLFSRYTDEDNLYYAGIRVDGHAVVKKKSNGVYYTLVEREVFEGDYDREGDPNLLPTDRWIGMRAVTADEPDGSVSVALYLDRENTGDWQLVAKGIDAGVGGEPFRESGRTGIRTDFMDVEFDDYSVKTGR